MSVRQALNVKPDGKKDMLIIVVQDGVRNQGRVKAKNFSG
jgi:hypothetical protein